MNEQTVLMGITYSTNTEKTELNKGFIFYSLNLSFISTKLFSLLIFISACKKK